VFEYLRVSLPFVYDQEHRQPLGTLSLVTTPCGTPERLPASGRSRNGAPVGTKLSPAVATGCSIPSCSARYSTGHHVTGFSQVAPSCAGRWRVIPGPDSPQSRSEVDLASPILIGCAPWNCPRRTRTPATAGTAGTIRAGRTAARRGRSHQKRCRARYGDLTPFPARLCFTKTGRLTRPTVQDWD
jgi:hypothetical protein